VPLRTSTVAGAPREDNTRQEVLDAMTDASAGRLGSIPATYVAHGAVRGEISREDLRP